MISKKKYAGIIILAAVIVIILAIIYLTRPFQELIGSYSASLDGLTFAQRKNICLSVRKIDNKRLLPEQIFSFNRVVGPRTLENGFLPSRALYERGTIQSVGGGICLVSSMLYNVAVRSGMDIVERIAHTNLIRSMPPGLDATVWYGVNDLKFRNNTSSRVLIRSECSYNRVNISMYSSQNIFKPVLSIKKKKQGADLVQVCVYRQTRSGTEKLSEDVYLIK